MLFSQSPPKPRGETFQSRPQIRNLTTTSKNLYVAFNTFQLEMSRLSAMQQFQNLMGEITHFNDELAQWKKDQHKIPNLTLTYHLYENLFSRLKYISNFSRNEVDAQNAVAEAARWFQTEKPKLRCQVKEVKASMKSCTPDKKQSGAIQAMVQSSALKREMLPYEMMSRTAHPGIFPPKEQLKEYKRKQFLPYAETESPEDYMTAKKSTSASLLQRSKLSKFRASVTTMMGTTSTSNFKQTKDNFRPVEEFKVDEIKQDQKDEDIILPNPEDQPKTEGQGELGEDQIDEMQREKKVNQDEAMQENLVQQVNEEDDADEEQIYEEEEADGRKGMRVYIRDHDKVDVQIAEEEAKEAVHSTMRRVMRVNEDKIRSKMEEMDLKRNMLAWGKAKGKNNREEARKLETLLHLNKFKNLEFQRKAEIEAEEAGERRFFNATTGFKDFQKAKEPVVVPMLHRSKSSHPSSMEADIEKLRIQQAMRTYGRYISGHVPSQGDSSPLEVQNKAAPQTDSTDFRSMSLTSFAKAPKKTSFSKLMAEHNPQVYNENLETDTMRIKSTLSGKSLPVQEGTIYKALSIVPKQDTLVSNGMYTSGRDLLSNPFFPKHLFGGKKKKKSKK